MKKIFLLIGIVLSILSKVLQFKFQSIWGDIIILPAAVCFIITILLYNKTYDKWLKEKNKLAILFGVICILAVLSFQLFTMITFGYGNYKGYLFIIPLTIFLLVGLYYFNKLSK